MMGHYASEMMCGDCGQTRCGCLHEPVTGFTEWVVDSNHEVLTVADFDEKYSHYLVDGIRVPSPGLGLALRLGRAHFDAKDKAQAHALKLLDNSIAASEEQTKNLRAKRSAMFGELPQGR